MSAATLTTCAADAAIVMTPRPRGCSVRRYYDPQTGQFISLDPRVDQTSQPYDYAADDPIDATDPLGLWPGEGLLQGAENAYAGDLYWATQQFDSLGSAIGSSGIAAPFLGAGNWLGTQLGDAYFGFATAHPCLALGIQGGVQIGGLFVAPEEEAAADAAAVAEDGYVNLATEARTTHILEGDATGGGHLWPGLPGKTPFPQDWSAARVMHEISDVASDPASARVVQGGKTVVTGTRGGVDIEVIIDNKTGEIVTGYPTNLPRNP
jgi:hypothetical protein